MIYLGNPILRREYKDDKLGVLDIIAKLNDNELCNIEMQVAKQDTIIERILYYWGRTYTRQLTIGNQYDNLQKTIVILISNFAITGLENLEYHTSWKLIEEKYRKTILTEKLEIRIIELSKIAKLYYENDKLLDWLFFLDNPESERVIESMKENKELQEASKKLEELSNDEHMRRMAEWRESAIWEHHAAISSGYRKGVSERYERWYKNGYEKRYEKRYKTRHKARHKARH